MHTSKTTREDIIRMLNNNGFGFIVDGEIVHTSQQEQLNQAFELACKCCFIDLVRELHERGAEIVGNAEPLKTAADYNQLEVAQFLVERGADINGHSLEQGQTALMDAAGSASLAVFQFLIELGADVDATDENGSTALDWARAGRHSALIPELRVLADAIRKYDTIIETLSATKLPEDKRRPSSDH